MLKISLLLISLSLIPPLYFAHADDDYESGHQEPFLPGSGTIDEAFCRQIVRTKNDFALLILLLDKHRDFTKLNLTFIPNYHFGDEELFWLSSVLEDSQNLISLKLNFRKADFGEVGIMNLKESLKKLKFLKHLGLDFPSNSIEKGSIASLAHAFSFCSIHIMSSPNHLQVNDEL